MQTVSLRLGLRLGSFSLNRFPVKQLRINST